MTDEKLSCVPCAIGVPVAIADHICKLTDNKECAQLQADLMDKKISVDQYFEKVGEILKEKNVDAIVTVGTTTDIMTLIRQMKENKFSVKYFHGYKGTGQAAFAKALGKDSQYIVTDGMWSDNFPYPKAQELGKQFYNKFQRQSTTAGLWYATAQILFQAIERAGTLDSAKVREAVVNHEFKGSTMGDVKYGPEGAATFNQTASQWIDGQLKLVFPSVKGSVKVQAAPAWDKR